MYSWSYGNSMKLNNSNTFEPDGFSLLLSSKHFTCLSLNYAYNVPWRKTRVDITAGLTFFNIKELRIRVWSSKQRHKEAIMYNRQQCQSKEEEWPRSERWAHFLNPDVYKPTLSINSECEPHKNKTGQMRHGEATLHSERKGEFWNKGWVVKIVYSPQKTKDKNQFLSTVHKIKGYPCNTEEWTRAQMSEFKNYRLWSNKPARAASITIFMKSYPSLSLLSSLPKQPYWGDRGWSWWSRPLSGAQVWPRRPGWPGGAAFHSPALVHMQPVYIWTFTANKLHFPWRRLSAKGIYS